MIATDYMIMTDDEILKEHQHKQIENWLSNLNFVAKEIDLLLKIADKNNVDFIIKSNFLEYKEKCILLVGQLHSHKNSLTDFFSECTDVECDAFFLNRQDETLDAYDSFIKDYRTLKIKLLEAM